MSDPSTPDPDVLVQPDPDDCDFDLHGTLDSVVTLRSHIPEDALTAAALGTERAGNGVVIGGDGLVVTIGYLVTEAESVWITASDGTTVPGHVAGYDQETGFGLVQALQPLGAPEMALGRSGDLVVGDPVIVAGQGGVEHAIRARIIARREFAGYWEYVLDEALFTAPAHPNWGGAALIGSDGKLLGVGSLLVQQVAESGQVSGANMIVPIDILKPILGDLRLYGRPNHPARPWLGFLVQEVGEHLVVAAVYDGCPAHRAGLRVGDVIAEVDGARVSGLAELFRRIWAAGPAGTEVPLTVIRDNEAGAVTVHSVDRNDCLKSARIH